MMYLRKKPSVRFEQNVGFFTVWKLVTPLDFVEYINKMGGNTAEITSISKSLYSVDDP